MSEVIDVEGKKHVALWVLSAAAGACLLLHTSSLPLESVVVSGLPSPPQVTTVGAPAPIKRSSPRS